MKKPTKKPVKAPKAAAQAEPIEMTAITVNAREIPLDLIDTNPDNPRKLDPTDPDLEELAVSIAKTGLLQPILVRPMPGGRYEVRAGARRFAAHQRLNAPSILAVIREMDDATAMQATVLENLQRKDLTMLEEADGVQKLLDLGRPIEQIALELGKSPSWTARRASLTNLTPKARAEIAKYNTPLAGCLAVATMPPEEQDRLIDEDTWAFRRREADALIKAVAESRQLLHKAVFDKAGCAACQKRSDRNSLLFDEADATDPKKVKCLDATCWKMKRGEKLAAVREAAEKAHPNLVIVRTEDAPYDSHERDLPELQTGKYSHGCSYRKPTKDDPPASRLTALITYGPGEGKLVEVVSLVKPKESDRPIGTDGKKVEKTDRERVADLVTKRKAWMIEAFKPLLRGKSPIPLGAVQSWPAEHRLSVVLAFGTCDRQNGLSNWRWKSLDTSPTAEAILEAVVAPMHSALTVRTLADAAKVWDEVLRIGELFGWDVFMELREQAIAACPMSKRLIAAKAKDPFTLDGDTHTGRLYEEFRTPGALKADKPETYQDRIDRGETENEDDEDQDEGNDQ